MKKTSRSAVAPSWQPEEGAPADTRWPVPVPGEVEQLGPDLGGIGHDGRALFPMMPYTQYRAISDDDMRAVVAYLRSLPPVKNAVPATQINFPVSFFIKMAPQPLEGAVASPDQNDPVAYGKYLAKVSGCQFCHTPVDSKHQPIPGMDFSGGQEFPGPWGIVRSANITPGPGAACGPRWRRPRSR
mgnify:CR=1 FL=1